MSANLKQFALGTLFSLFGTVLALVAIEIVFRFLPSPAVWSDRPVKYFRPEAAPDNRDYLYSVPKPTNTFRIAVVGDSFTFAPFMQFSDTFPKRMETMLNLNSVSQKAEVLNYGYPAYSTTNEVPVVQKALAEDADLVVLQITLNDPELKPYQPQGISEDAFAQPKINPFLARILKHWKTLAFVFERFHNSQTHRAYVEYYRKLYNSPASWATFKDAVHRISLLCRAERKPLVAAVFPLFGTSLDDSYPFFELHKKINELLDAEQIQHIDLFESFRGIPLERLQVIPGVDRHPNEIGHRIAAENIYQFLANKDLVPNELKIKQLMPERVKVKP